MLFVSYLGFDFALMKFRTFITPLAAVAGLVFVVGLALLGGLLLRNPLTLIDQGGLRSPAALQFVPKQATLVASLLTRPDHLTDVWEYLTAPSLRQDTRRDIEQIERTLLAGTGLSYKQDILPWLGEEVTAAVISPDIDQNPDNGREPGYLVALGCKDSQAARTMLELFWQNRAIAGDALTFEDFSGNRLIYSNQRPAAGRDQPAESWVPSSFNRLATTVVANQFVLVANHPDVLRQALNAAQSNDNNLAADRRYRVALQALPEPRVGVLALSLPALAKTLTGPSTPTVADHPLSHLGEPGDAVDWGLVSFGLTREGLLGDVALVAASGQRLQPRQARLTGLPSVAAYLPGGAAVTAVGQNLKTLWAGIGPLWQQYGGTTHAKPIMGNSLAPAVDADWTHDLLDSVVHDFALGLNPGRPSDWLLVTQQSAAMMEALQRLQVSAQAAGIGVNTLTIQGQSTTALAQLTLKPSLTAATGSNGAVIAQVMWLYTQVDNVNILASSPASMEATLSRWRGTPDPAAWTQYLALFRTPNEGYIQINWPKLQSGLRQEISRFRLWEIASQPVLSHLKHITLTSYGRTDQLQTGRIFFQLSNQ
jgi:hypothetical protein